MINMIIIVHVFVSTCTYKYMYNLSPLLYPSPLPSVPLLFPLLYPSPLLCPSPVPLSLSLFIFVSQCDIFLYRIMSDII